MLEQSCLLIILHYIKAILLIKHIYSITDDIRNWATQPDPCLSLLDEWFATHKTREGTYAVMKMLVEINQREAAEIVEKALQDVENIIEDEEEDVDDPPEVFISYQWSHQPEVKLLKKHLEMAGFKSWMDVGQMGGGDKLYSKIDAGIRAAKIIICCVTTKYAQSPNCNKEVQILYTSLVKALTLKKKFKIQIYVLTILGEFSGDSWQTNNPVINGELAMATSWSYGTHLRRIPLH